MGKFLNAQATADKLIRKFGSSLTVTRKTPGTIDPVTDTEVGGSEVQTAYFGVGLPPSQQSRHQIGTLEGRNVLEFYFALKGQERKPEVGDIVSMPDGTTYTLFHTQTYDPAGDGPIMTVAYGER